MLGLAGRTPEASSFYSYAHELGSAPLPHLQPCPRRGKKGSSSKGGGPGCASLYAQPCAWLLPHIAAAHATRGRGAGGPPTPLPCPGKRCQALIGELELPAQAQPPPCACGAARPALRLRVDRAALEPRGM
jgi:hypothetical protein